MKSRSIIILLSALSLLVVSSCNKKKDDTTTDPYLSGSLKFDIPAFVLQKEEYKLTPRGVTNPTTGNVGYYWTCSWDSSRDTTKTETGLGDGSWTITVPEDIGYYNITVYAYATDYSPLSTTVTFAVINPAVDSTLTGAGYQLDSAAFVDSRDGGVYYLATIGGKVWMQNNLYYQDKGVSYQNSTAIDPVFGRLYTWAEAQGACPSGWHLPSDTEFAAMAGSSVGGSFTPHETFQGAAGSLMADTYFIGTKMWTFWPEVKITNASKFSAIPIGYAIDQDVWQRFTGTNSYAVFWTSDDDDDTGIYRYVYVDKNNVYCARGDKESFRASVRCVKDED